MLSLLSFQPRSGKVLAVGEEGETIILCKEVLYIAKDSSPAPILLYCCAIKVCIMMYVHGPTSGKGNPLPSLVPYRSIP